MSSQLLNIFEPVYRDGYADEVGLEVEKEIGFDCEEEGKMAPTRENNAQKPPVLIAVPSCHGMDFKSVQGKLTHCMYVRIVLTPGRNNLIGTNCQEGILPVANQRRHDMY